MKKFSNRILNALQQRLMIPLEYKPCDAVQTAYFDTLYAMRRELAARRETETGVTQKARTGNREMRNFAQANGV